MMQEKFNTIIIGTGMTECILSALLAINNIESENKVLCIDSNNYYGSETTSLNLNQFVEKFKLNKINELNPKSKEWNIDLVPKIFFANGLLTKLIRFLKIKSIDFVAIEGSYIYQNKKINKLPLNYGDVLSSSLLNLFDKIKCISLLKYIYNYEENNEKTWNKYNLFKMTTHELLLKFSIGEIIQNYLGHGVASFFNDNYLQEPAINFVRKIKLYYESLIITNQSPFIYPLYGLGEISQSFARLSSVHGGGTMLNTKILNIVKNINNQYEVTINNDFYNGILICDNLIVNPSVVNHILTCDIYEKIIRCICITSNKIKSTNNNKGTQIIIYGSEINQKNDAYMVSFDNTYNVCEKNYNIYVISKIQETDDYNNEMNNILKIFPELQIIEQVVYIQNNYYCHNNDWINIKQIDQSTHIESVMENVFEIYKKITGKKSINFDNNTFEI